MFEFSLAFREDIDSANSSCISKNNMELCTLKKAEAHYFDRLTRGANDLSKQLAIDWSRWREVQEAVDAGFEEYDDEVNEMDDAAFAKAEAENDVVIVDIAFPWCHKCT